MDLAKELLGTLTAMNRARAAELQGDPVLAMAARVLPIAADDLRDDNDRASRGERIAKIDLRDERDLRTHEDQEAFASSICPTEISTAYGARSVVTWAPDGLTYTSESGNEQTARWAGYRLLSEIRSERENEEIEVVWWGTKPTARGTFAAQFEVVGDDNVESVAA